MTGLTLAQRILALEDALAGVPHAFGGALALAYYAEPRTTVDIDLNVFLPPARYDEIAGKLEKLGAPDGELVIEDGVVHLEEAPLERRGLRCPRREVRAGVRALVREVAEYVDEPVAEHLAKPAHHGAKATAIGA